MFTRKCLLKKKNLSLSLSLGLLILRYPTLESRELYTRAALVSCMGPISSSARSASSLADHAGVVGGKEGLVL